MPKLASVSLRTFIESNSEQQHLEKASRRCLLFSRQRIFLCHWRYRERITQYKSLLSLHNPLKQESKHPHSSLSSGFCSLFVTVRVCRESDASIRHSKSISEIQNPYGPLSRIRLIFLKSIKSLLGPNFQGMLKDGLPVLGGQWLEEIFTHHIYELSFIVFIDDFGGKSHLKQNNKRGEGYWDIVFIMYC